MDYCSRDNVIKKITFSKDFLENRSKGGIRTRMYSLNDALWWITAYFNYQGYLTISLATTCRKSFQFDCEIIVNGIPARRCCRFVKKGHTEIPFKLIPRSKLFADYFGYGSRYVNIIIRGSVCSYG